MAGILMGPNLPRLSVFRNATMLEQISACLTALYLRGMPRSMQLPRRNWVKVVSCLRASECPFDRMSAALRAGGLWEEAICLESNDTLGQAVRLVELGAVLTAVDVDYPRRRMERLGQTAPPALWIRGVMPAGPLIGIVGSRQIEKPIQQFAFEIGTESVRLGNSVVSGGAAGCDFAGASGAVAEGGHAIEILPHGIDLYSRTDRCGLSVCAPDEVFSTATAMERNTLIYAASEQTVVIQARFKQGGTWIGAAEATRKRLCPLIVRDDGSQASQALIALGATPIKSPQDLGQAIAITPEQRGLFEIG
jgi:predicted Rossmann fold nucleotide-binding protein DprA/Smf involved in DNA uptake